MDVGVEQFDSSGCKRHRDQGGDDARVTDPFGAEGTNIICRNCMDDRSMRRKEARAANPARSYAKIGIKEFYEFYRVVFLRDYRPRMFGNRY